MVDEQKSAALDSRLHTTPEQVETTHIDGQLEQLAAHIDDAHHLNPHLAKRADELLTTEHQYAKQDIHLEHAQELASLHHEIREHNTSSPERISETSIDQTPDTHSHGKMTHLRHSMDLQDSVPIPSAEQIAANRTAAAANTHEFISTIKQKPRNIVQKRLGSLLSTA